MHYRPLGKSPLKVSTLCLGTMMFADQTDLAEARRIVHHAHDHGVNFIDTADVYGDGRSERLVARLHAKHGLEFFSIGGGLGIVYQPGGPSRGLPLDTRSAATSRSALSRVLTGTLLSFWSAASRLRAVASRR